MVRATVSTLPAALVSAVELIVAVQAAPVPRASVTVQLAAVAVSVLAEPVSALEPNAKAAGAIARLPPVRVTSAVVVAAFAAPGTTGSRAVATKAAIAILRARTGNSSKPAVWLASRPSYAGGGIHTALGTRIDWAPEVGYPVPVRLPTGCERPGNPRHRGDAGQPPASTARPVDTRPRSRCRRAAVESDCASIGRVTDWDDRLAALWASLDQVSDEPGADGFVATMAALVAELPTGSPVGAFERAAAFDSTGHSDRAVPLYREALAGDLDPERRRRAVIQLASSLRNLGRPDESVALLRTERAAGSDPLDDAVDAFLALALADTGHEREALSYA